MTRSQSTLEASRDAAGATISSLAAMIHFHSTGERWKLRLVVSNGRGVHLRRSNSRPVLRVIPVSEPQLSA